MSLHMQQLREHLAPGHAVCLALISVSGERFVIVGVDSMRDENDIREVARVAICDATFLGVGGRA